MTTAAACGPPRCLGSIMVGERCSLVSREGEQVISVFPRGVTGILLCVSWRWQIAALLCLSQAVFTHVEMAVSWTWLSLADTPLSSSLSHQCLILVFIAPSGPVLALPQVLC